MRITPAYFRKRKGLALVLSSCLLAASTTFSARGADIQVVTLTTDGPNKSLPLGEAFYLAGSATAPDVVRAHAVIVRVSWPFLGLGGPDTGACGRLQKERGVPANLGQVTGQVDAGALWPGTAEPEPTLVPEPWKRSGAEDQYKILVPSGPFFRPGASYCLYVFLQTKTTQRQDTAFKKVLLEFGTDNRACLNQHCSGTKIRCMEPALAAYEQCAQAAADKMTSRLDDVFQGIPSNDLQAAWDAIRARLINASWG
jgi:hypothetical protein